MPVFGYRWPAACLGLALLGWAGLAGAQERPDLSRGEQLRVDSFRRETQRLADACLADISSKAEWERRRPELRRQFLEMMGLWPLPPRTDLKPVITGKIDSEHFTVEKLHFQSRPGLYVTANLYVPKASRERQRPEEPRQPPGGKYPAVLYVCGHAN